MLTFEDCLTLYHLTKEEVSAIAEHEQIPEIAAAEYGERLIQTADGEQHIKRMIVDDIQQAKDTNNQEQAEKLELILKHFVLHHPKLQVLL